jgi:hypothetical protein
MLLVFLPQMQFPMGDSWRQTLIVTGTDRLDCILLSVAPLWTRLLAPEAEKASE